MPLKKPTQPLPEVHLLGNLVFAGANRIREQYRQLVGRLVDQGMGDKVAELQWCCGYTAEPERVIFSADSEMELLIPPRYQGVSEQKGAVSLSRGGKTEQIVITGEERVFFRLSSGDTIALQAIDGNQLWFVFACRGFYQEQIEHLS